MITINTLKLFIYLLDGFSLLSLIISTFNVSQGNNCAFNVSQSNKSTFNVSMGNNCSLNISQGNNKTFNVSQGNNCQLSHSDNYYTSHFVSLMYGFSKI